MRFVKLDEILKRKVLEVSIKSRDRKKQINNRTVHSDSIMDIIIKNGLDTVLVEDRYDICELYETLKEGKRLAIHTRLQEIFHEIENDELNDNKLFRLIRQEIIPTLSYDPVRIPPYQIISQDDMIAHCVNVALLSIRTAKILGFNNYEIEQMAYIALLHDIGKLPKAKDRNQRFIPHYEYAQELLNRKNSTVLCCKAILSQEEFYNVSIDFIMPDDQAYIFGQILNVCDFYEKLFRRTILLPGECIDEMQSFVNIRFDSEIFEAFVKAINIQINKPERLSKSPA